MVRPRGWHLQEKHLIVDGAPVAGALVDFGLYFFHNARRLLDARQRARTSTCRRWSPTWRPGSGTTSSSWRRTCSASRSGTIRATVLIETIPAAFEMEEILYELRDHAAGLNAGRWDYLFSLIKNFRDARRRVRAAGPQRGHHDRAVHAGLHRLLVRDLPQRGAHAIGGMAAFIPNRRDPEVNERRFAKVRADKTREAGDGFDGSWVAHPDLVPICREVFDARPRRPAEPARPASARTCRSTPPSCSTSPATPGERHRGRPAQQRQVALQLPRGLAARATARSHLQPDGGRRHRRDLPLAGLAVDRTTPSRWPTARGQPGLVEQVIDEEIATIAQEQGDGFDAAGYDAARALFVEVALADDFAEFLTLPAYERMP